MRLARELPTDTLYRVVEAEDLSEERGDGEEVPDLLELVKRTCRHILKAVKRATPEMDVLTEAADAGVLCDQVASALIPTPAVRQALLEEMNVERRLRRLLAELSRLLTQLRNG